MRPKIGHIQFLNCLPLYYGLINKKALFDIELIKGTPTELNRMLIDGDLDVSPISSIEYCRNADKLLLLPKLTVSSDGEVKSILLISKVPITELQGKSVALTTSSATSRILTHIILKKKYNLDVKYIDNKSSLPKTLEEADAVLLIGDEALQVLYNPQGLLLYDLGKEWQEFTNKKMVYAVWAVRREFAERDPDLIQKIYTNFIASMQYSSARLSEVASACARWETFDADFLYDYFKSLRFEFGKEYQDGLINFFVFAKEYGFVQNIPELEFAAVKDYISKKLPFPFTLLSDMPSQVELSDEAFTLISKGIKDVNHFLHIMTPPGMFKPK
ncbi:menaquinone biosynthesis protein [Candidatus Poribacteria bacterium]|nr:menaquinone biosynthesis protein [Candidatus Poribacteria bacterium]